MTWGRPDGREAAAVAGTLRPRRPVPSAGAPGPVARTARDRRSGLAAEAGLSPRAGILDDRVRTWPDAATSLRSLHSSGVAIRAASLAGEDAVTAAHAAALAPFRQPDGSFRIGARYVAMPARA